MPELPEVEITKRSLSKHILHQKIKAVTIINPRLRYRLNKKNFAGILNQKISNVKRRSKYILIHTTKKDVLLIHLGMTGRFYFMHSKEKKIDTSFYTSNSIIQKHDHLKISFAEFDLVYNDIRKFGFIKLLKEADLDNVSHLEKLGPEPLSKEFNKKYLYEQLRKKKLSIKNFLMNQQNVSGLGNIYVNEALFFSKIHPERECFKINKIKVEILLKHIKKILSKAILKGGSTIDNYHNSEGKTGSYQANFRVYGREGETCLTQRCSSTIKRKFSMGRSFFFCPNCQRI